jgi:hypothetical protein
MNPIEIIIVGLLLSLLAWGALKYRANRNGPPKPITYWTIVGAIVAGNLLTGLIAAVVWIVILRMAFAGSPSAY